MGLIPLLPRKVRLHRLFPFLEGLEALKLIFIDAALALPASPFVFTEVASMRAPGQLWRCRSPCRIFAM